MRIEAIHAEVVNASIYSNYIFVIAETDEGVMGFGDATLDGMETEVVAAVNHMGSQLVGKDVVNDNLSVSGASGGLVTAAAASGIDIAMWDLKGKALNVPIYQLLGGAIRKKIPVYASFNRIIRDRTPEGFGEFAEQLVAKGNTALKCHPFCFADLRLLIVLQPDTQTLDVEVDDILPDLLADLSFIQMCSHRRVCLIP